jgi:hypothetical protein
MNLNTAKNLFLNDLEFVINYIVENNPQAVYSKLSAYKNPVFTHEGIMQSIGELLSQGKGLEVMEILNVPYNPNNSLGYNEALIELGYLRNSDANDPNAGVIPVVGSDVTDTNTTTSNSGTDFVSIMNGITSTNSFLSGLFNTFGGSGAENTAQPSEKDNTTLYIIIGVVLVLVVGAAIAVTIYKSNK